MLNLVQVQSFVAIIEKGGFIEAARHLEVSQPTVSQHLRKLEEQLGAALVQRTRGGIAPTARGAIFLPFARRLIKGAERSIQAIDGLPLAIAASSNPGIYLLPPLAHAYKASSAKKQDIQLFLGSNPESLSRLESGEADLSILETWDNRPGYEAIVWRKERLVVIVSPEHEWSARRSIRADELKGQPVIGGESGSGTGRALRAALGPIADRLTTVQNLGSTDAVKKAVAASLGISIVMASCVSSEVREGKLHPIDIDGADLSKSIYIILPAETPANTEARKFAAFLRETAIP
ncbi:MAG TPA: LysR family transcriptional regulator [Bradyrhizobium sp.]|nr:LysR family transcriptional regulator [Bradyrhizobium sp.]